MIVPTYNERQDIEATLDAVLAQNHSFWELIVVDDGSTDDTLGVLHRHRHADAWRLIAFGCNRGVSAARNAGIDAASGDVTVFLDADVTLPPDFLCRIAGHYADGADCVSCEARVQNTGSVVARFNQADHEVQFGRELGYAVVWTQGFSCRRALAAAARFPEELPGCGGEDGEFVQRLARGEPRWIHDSSIVVPYRVPDRLDDFWHQSRGRGAPIPYIDVCLRGRSLPLAALRRVAALVRTLALAAALVPNLVASIARARRSERGMRDLPTFWALVHVRALARHLGEWRSLARIRRERRGQGVG